MDCEESELLKLLIIDLKQHFKQLVLLYQDGLYTFIARLAINEQEAADIVQETLLGAYVTLTHYPPERVQALRLRSWLYKIALNVWRNSKRGLRPRILPLESLTSDTLYTSEQEPDAIYELVERSQELQEHLVNLPEQYRIVIIGYFFEDLSYQEIADLLDLPIGTVKSRLHRAIHMLRQQMGTHTQECSVSRELG